MPDIFKDKEYDMARAGKRCDQKLESGQAQGVVSRVKDFKMGNHRRLLSK